MSGTPGRSCWSKFRARTPSKPGSLTSDSTIAGGFALQGGEVFRLMRDTANRESQAGLAQLALDQLRVGGPILQ